MESYKTANVTAMKYRGKVVKRKRQRGWLAICECHTKYGYFGLYDKHQTAIRMLSLHLRRMNDFAPHS